MTAIDLISFCSVWWLIDHCETWKTLLAVRYWNDFMAQNYGLNCECSVHEWLGLKFCRTLWDTKWTSDGELQDVARRVHSGFFLFLSDNFSFLPESKLQSDTVVHPSSSKCVCQICIFPVCSWSYNFAFSLARFPLVPSHLTYSSDVSVWGELVETIVMQRQML